MLIGLLLGISGCAGMVRSQVVSPPTVPVWALFTDSELVLGPRAVIHIRSQIACEKSAFKGMRGRVFK